MARVKSGQAQFDEGQDGPGSQVGLEHIHQGEVESPVETDIEMAEIDDEIACVTEQTHEIRVYTHECRGFVL